MTSPAPAKGEKTPLLHTKQARERIVVGLRWDPREDQVKLLNKLVKKDSQHDLDVSCYVYGAGGEFLDYVGAEAQDSMDESGKIYHSGDDMCGSGDGDDETISAELADLPSEIHALVFLVDVRSNHNFAHVLSPMTRLADGMNDKNLLEIHLDHDESKHKNAFVMCSIYRNDESPTGWMLYNISEYPDTTTIPDWGSYLAQFTG